MCWLHTWQRWEQYEISMPIIYDGKQAVQHQRRQRRKCAICGKEQDKKIRGSAREKE